MVLLAVCAPMQLILQGHILQSGIDNHRTALWTQVRTAFRSNINETDENKVRVLVIWSGHGSAVISGCISSKPILHTWSCSYLQIDEQKDA